jgi:hypothetical protein
MTAVTTWLISRVSCWRRKSSHSFECCSTEMRKMITDWQLTRKWIL